MQDRYARRASPRELTLVRRVIAGELEDGFRYADICGDDGASLVDAIGQLIRRGFVERAGRSAKGIVYRLTAAGRARARERRWAATATARG